MKSQVMGGIANGAVGALAPVVRARLSVPAGDMAHLRSPAKAAASPFLGHGFAGAGQFAGARAGFAGSVLAAQHTQGYSAKAARNVYPTLFNNSRFNVSEARRRSHAET